MQPVTPSSTDVSVTIRIIDSDDGTPEEGVTSSTSGLALWYKKGATGAETALTESDLANDEASHSDGGMAHINDGLYRVDLPDAAVPTSEHEVTIVGGTATDMIVLGAALVGRTAALTAAEVNAECDTAISDAALATAAALATVDSNVDAILADTDELQTDDVPGLIAALNDPTAAAIWAAITDAAANKIADHTIRRTFENACDSSDGDAKAGRSLLGAIAKLVNKVAVSGSTLTVYEDDDSTSLLTQTLTTDSDADPVVGADTA